MKKDAKPFCKEGKSVISIQNNNNNGDCQISLKRVDREWTQWSQTDETVDTRAEYREIKIFEREITVLEAHGGKTGDDTRNRYTETLYWLTFVKQLMNFSDAKANCESNNGHLFYDVDGTAEQLNWLFEKMDRQTYWLGIYTKDFIDWISLDGEVLNSKLQWKAGQPNNVGGQQKYASSGGDYGSKLGDLSESALLYSVCHIVWAKSVRDTVNNIKFHLTSNHSFVLSSNWPSSNIPQRVQLTKLLKLAIESFKKRLICLFQRSLYLEVFSRAKKLNLFINCNFPASWSKIDEFSIAFTPAPEKWWHSQPIKLIPLLDVKTLKYPPRVYLPVILEHLKDIASERTHTEIYCSFKSKT